MNLFNFTGMISIIGTFVGFGFNSAPVSMDKAGCLVFESHFDFSVSDTHISELFAHFMDSTFSRDFVEWELVLNSLHYEKYKGYFDCLEMNNRGLMIYCMRPPDYVDKPRYNIIRAKICRWRVSEKTYS